MKVSETATGSILTAFGTALPESVVTLVAAAFGVNAAQKEIGVGAALGGPLALSNVAYALVGIVSLFAARGLGCGQHPVIHVESRRLNRLARHRRIEAGLRTEKDFAMSTELQQPPSNDLPKPDAALMTLDPGAGDLIVINTYVVAPERPRIC